MYRIWRIIKGVWFFCWGNIFATLLYDRRNLRGRWFSGKLHGLCAIGWQWVVHDAIGRLFLKHNSEARFPVSQKCIVQHPERIVFHPDDLNNFQSFGQYYQAHGGIIIGKGSYIAPNVGLITANHNPTNLEEHLPPKAIQIGEQCWIGMNSVILPGVILGEKTVVGAGAVVTKSFTRGHCIIAGNPANIIKEFELEDEIHS